MLPKKVNKTNYAFIDSQNLMWGIKSQGWDLDFSKFIQYLKTKYQVKKAYLFIGYIPENQSLYTYLQSVGYICIFKPTLEIHPGTEDATVKGNVDAELVLQVMIDWHNYHKAIIVSGDGDFHCLIQHLESHNKLLKILAPNKKFSSLLRKYAQYIVNISYLKKKLQRK